MRGAIDAADLGPHIDEIGPLSFKDRGKAVRAVYYGPRAYRRATDGV